MDVDKLVDQLTLEEKASLTAGRDMWSTHAVKRVGVPAIRMSDGPSGVRGLGALSKGTESVCIPCGSTLGATWNPQLVRELGELLGDEARAKSVRILLAPTVNLHRSPLAGRNFECYSEDPVLSGILGAAFIRGVQSRGVAATVKHFVANDSEYERHTASSVVDERTLREIYLLPFEMAIRDGGALAVMSAYNRLNGIYCGENEWLLRTLLKDEWGFEGLVVTDWWAVGSTLGSGHAGVDIEMPGPRQYFGTALADAVKAGRIAENTINDKVRRFLTVIDRIGAWADSAAPQVLRPNLPEDRRLTRQAAIEGTVLLRNDGVLPIKVENIRRIAVLGPNADQATITGGGSATVKPHYLLSPLKALQLRIGHCVDIVHEPGCSIDQKAPLDASMLFTPDGQRGMLVEIYANSDFTGDVVDRRILENTQLNFVGPPCEGIDGSAFSARATANFLPTTSGTYSFNMHQLGAARLRINGETILDGFTSAPPLGIELTASVDLIAGNPVDFIIELSSKEAALISGAPEFNYAVEGSDTDVRLVSAAVGCTPPNNDELLDRAVTAAHDADAVVLVVGTNSRWETEGSDRASMDLPGEQNELIKQVLAANSTSIVIVNAGSPVTMPWANDAPAILYTGFGGQEMSNAVTDIIFGDADPGGRLPTSFPICAEQNPSYGNFPSENDELNYGERLLMGYRWYDTRKIPTLFPFGHGLSYTTFEFGEPSLSTTEIKATSTIRINIPVTNCGTRAGTEVVQCYVRPCNTRLFRPNKELKAFAKVRLEPNTSETVALELDARAFAYWDPGDPGNEKRRARRHISRPYHERREPGWYLDAGDYELQIGRSVEAIDKMVLVRANKTTRIESKLRHRPSHEYV